MIKRVIWTFEERTGNGMIFLEDIAYILLSIGIPLLFE
ncbi:hypothetical protein BTH41_04973 [Bacillus mycoides]|nr:hypothetical protein BTH41_04973 [Bacillus mycoides]